MNVESTELAGCFEVQCRVLRDTRGCFVKTFHSERFEALGLNTVWREQYWSASSKGVLRGMHFQVPPAAQAKLVYCVSGAVLDVILDLRLGSPTYGQHLTRELSAENGLALYIPVGLAHGFLTLSQEAVMCYSVETVYSPEHDRGVLWSGCGVDWPVDDQTAPRISERDAGFPDLETFESPF